MRNLGHLLGRTTIFVDALNAQGEVAGIAEPVKGGDYVPFVWQDGRFTTIHLGDFWEPVGINDAGQVALNESDEWALWQDGKIQYRGSGEATGLNERGQVTIAGWDDDVPRIWQDGKVTKLPLLNGDEGGVPLGLNEGNEVVGLSGTLAVDSGIGNYTWNCHVVLWTWQAN